jgi:xanthine dehydrogenase accessory factor
MKDLFKYLSSGNEMVLVTVVAASGATPRGAGAKMLVNEKGRIWGTIGGGAVEYRALQMADKVLKEQSASVHQFTLNKDDIQNLGMVCGGEVQVFFQYISPEDDQITNLAKTALDAYERNEELWILSDMKEDGKLSLYHKKNGFMGSTDLEWIKPYLSRKPKLVKENGNEIYVEQICSASKVFVFGGGHVAQELVPVLEHVGFRCTVMDDREEFANEALFPTAEKVMLIDFEKISDFVEIGENDYVCVMTRGHSYDTSVQAQILKTPASYIGVIGSASKKAAVYKKLYEMGFTEADTDRITSPIGLSIKAETPAEIAISIAGQMILHRAEKNNRS